MSHSYSILHFCDDDYHGDGSKFQRALLILLWSFIIMPSKLACLVFALPRQHGARLVCIRNQHTNEPL